MKSSGEFHQDFSFPGSLGYWINFILWDIEFQLPGLFGILGNYVRSSFRIYFEETY
ncbi:hypothetical protein C1646_819991 [Rhizophagus diaphanus]|nr:hypothetical protein C1646_819991 [Rhizophagus diaphanus] [Rhizophagus sp. MUCL 43196]